MKEEKPVIFSKEEIKPIESLPAKEEMKSYLEEPKPVTKS